MNVENNMTRNGMEMKGENSEPGEENDVCIVDACIIRSITATAGSLSTYTITIMQQKMQVIKQQYKQQQQQQVILDLFKNSKPQ